MAKSFPPLFQIDLPLLLKQTKSKTRNITIPRLVENKNFKYDSNGFMVSTHPTTKGFLIGFTDGSRKAKYGIIKRDTGGAGVHFSVYCKKNASVPYQGTDVNLSSNGMEGLGIEEFLKLALRNNFKNVIVFTDSANVIKYVGENGLGYQIPLIGNNRFYADLLVAMAPMGNIRLVWTKGHVKARNTINDGNNAADLLATLGRYQHEQALHDKICLPRLTDADYKQRMNTIRKPDDGIELGILFALSSTMEYISRARIIPAAPANNPAIMPSAHPTASAAATQSAPQLPAVIQAPLLLSTAGPPQVMSGTKRPSSGTTVISTAPKKAKCSVSTPST